MGEIEFSSRGRGEKLSGEGNLWGSERQEREWVREDGTF